MAWSYVMLSVAVAKRTSVFDDPTLEIQELTAVIKQDITALNSTLVDLQLVCNSRNASGNISKDTTTHSTTVVDDLKNRLMSTTKEFKEVLTMRTEVSLNYKLSFHWYFLCVINFHVSVFCVLNRICVYWCFSTEPEDS